ncbi:MAG: metallophosphoesterase, partial [Thiogranum sp.]
SDAEYQTAVFDIYPDMLRKSVLWPAFGNHDGGSATSGDESGVFYDIFTLPRNAEAGGVASGTEAYYAFDFGNIHFLCLNSHDIDRSSTADMATWLRQDLAANTRDWIIAFWHHPPYTKSWTDSDSQSKLIDMRENLVPILEDGGVDLVLTGHNHAYERSFLLDGHYGFSWDLQTGMILDNGDGREDGDGVYNKPTFGPAAHEGTVYVVVGCSGSLSQNGTLDHPAMYLSLRELGSLVIDIDGDRADVTFLGDQANIIHDYFTIIKGSGAPAGPADLTATAVCDFSIELSWSDNSTDENGFNIERRTASNNFVEIAQVGTNVTTYTDAGLQEDTCYTYRVRAFNSNGPSTYSNEDSATVNISCFTYNFSTPGWYLISLPAQPIDSSLATLFPNATAAFAWDFASQNYLTSTGLVSERAYWLLMPQADTVEVPGLKLKSYSNSYTAAGWDMIGAVMDMNEVVDDPDGSVITMYGWDPVAQNYASVNPFVADPTQGYWILVFNVPSTVTVGSGASSSSGSSSSGIAKAGAHGADLEAFYRVYNTLPPPPPSSVFGDPYSESNLLAGFSLSQNSPNPFNPETVIGYQLPEPVRVSMKIYSI